MSFESPLPPYNASDPTATFLNASVLELLMIELVPLAHRVVADTSPSSSSSSSSPPAPDDDAVFLRLEALGYRVGQGLVERFSSNRPRFTDTLDAIKFLCKDLWMLLFRKQIDNLKTNHRGVYVLTDNSFRPFAKMSTEPGGNAVGRAQPFLWFPCGIVRGALSSMGIQATVQAETTELPSATFQIKSVTAKP